MHRRFNYLSNYSFWKKNILLPFLTVFAGGLIYILLRPTEVIFVNWFSTIGIENWLGALRERSLAFYTFLPDWIVYSLPNGLWAFAYTFIVLRIWKGSHSFIRYFWFLSILLLVFGFEVLQAADNIRGTFCWNDIFWGAIGISLGLLIIFKKSTTKIYRNEKE